MADKSRKRGRVREEGRKKEGEAKTVREEGSVTHCPHPHPCDNGWTFAKRTVPHP
jgi:hypothetical protein